MDCYEHRDWRELVKAAIRGRGMAQKDLATALDVSEGQLSMLLQGRRRLEDDAVIERFAAVLFPEPAERAWFEALVDAQSLNRRARLAAEAVIGSMLAHLEAPAPAIELMRMQADWRVSAILELATCAGFRPDAEWIASRLVPAIEPAEAAAVWASLVAANLVRERPDGTFDVRSLLQPSEVHHRAGAAAAALHEVVLGLAAQSLPGPPDERRGAVITMALSEDTARRMLARLREMEQELVALAAHDPGPKTRVFFVTTQLFPCSDFTDVP